MKTKLYRLNPRGELENPALLEDIRESYKPDSLLLKGFVPYIILLLCGAIDGCFFYSLFAMISYDSPVLLWFQVFGFLVGFDLIPVFIGIHYKKLQQGLTSDTLTLRLALGVCALVCAANIGLRIVTVDLAAPDLADTGGYFFEETEELPAQEEDSDAVAWMIAVTGMVVPLVTSIGSFYISNLCFDPLLQRKQRQETLIRLKSDRIRRLDTMIRAYEADADLERTLLEEDEKQYTAAKSMLCGLLLEYHTRLCRHPADASEGSRLLEALHRLCREAAEHTALPAPDTAP